MFVSGKDSSCYTGSENLVISADDKKGAAKVYPAEANEIATTTARRASILQKLVKAETVPPDAKEHFERTLKQLQS